MIVKCKWCGAVGESGTKCHKCSRKIQDVEEIIQICNEPECCEQCEDPVKLIPKRIKPKKDYGYEEM